jgi:hypothetical protein
MTWRNIPEPLYPWARTINRILRVEDPPNMSGPTMLLASDYGGIDKKYRYHVSTILCADMEASIGWETLRRDVRSRYLSDGRRMSYKALNDNQKKRALVPFLAAAEHIHGLCLVIIVNKSIRHLCLNSAADYQKMREVAQLKAQWRDQALESLLRMTHLVGFVEGGLSQPGQNIYWISDEDSLFANPVRHGDVARLLSSYSSHYVKHDLGELGVGTTSIDEGDRIEEDLASVADLVAGGVSEVMTRMAEHCGGRIPTNLAVERTESFLPKADLIARWLWLGKSNLRRVAVLFEKQPQGFSCSRYQMLGEG